ncbi:MAG: glycosyltransferase family 9 protein [Candidatus Kapabacteria bacterium]|nr:glycosyltransferase family 9 protein [Ignavibacteriota bacterium]MCW5884088.1 glycosyltransferase family 9 protein [Candidatus Kapabacteria bacterium]
MLKKIEYKIKNFFDKSIKRASNPELISQSYAKFKLVEGSRILLLRQDRIGDLLVTVPFVRSLRSAFPKIEIDILLSNKNFSAKRAIDSYVNNIYTYDKNIFKTLSLIASLKRRNYDIIIDMFDNPSTTSSYLIKMIKPLYSLGFEKENFQTYTHIVPLPDKRLVHIVERIANLLMPFGVNPSNNDLKLSFRLSPAETLRAKEMMKAIGDRILGINLSGSDRSKYWGTENYINFILKFSELFGDFDIVIFSMPEYKTELDEILKNTKAKNAPKSNSFVQYASYLSVCDLILTPDTAAVHLASAFDIPCLSLHLWKNLPQTGIPWTAYNTPQRNLRTESGKLADIKVDDAIHVISELIEENSIS